MRLLYLIIAYLSLGVAILGMVLPGLPTVEFLLLSAWAASKSSPRLHRMLMEHPVFGPPLRDWKNGGVVRTKAKITASVMMMIAATSMILFVPHIPSVVITIAGMSMGAIWLWRRPSRPPASYSSSSDNLASD